LEAVSKVSDKTRGPVYAEDWFAGVAWSRDESVFIDVADRPQAPAQTDCDDAGGGSGDEQRDSEDCKSRDVRRIASSLTGDGKTDADAWIDGLRNRFDQSARDPLGGTYIDRKSPPRCSWPTRGDSPHAPYASRIPRVRRSGRHIRDPTQPRRSLLLQPIHFGRVGSSGKVHGRCACSPARDGPGDRPHKL
jgi:hypothetical protein